MEKVLISIFQIRLIEFEEITHVLRKLLEQ